MSEANGFGSEPGVPAQHELFSYITNLAHAYKNTRNQVDQIETRQVHFDQRLANVCGQVQGLKENQDNFERLCFKRIDDMQAMSSRGSGAPHAWEAKLNEHERRLKKVVMEVASLTGGHSILPSKSANRPGASGLASALGERLSKLEQGQRKIASGARHALRTTIALHDEQMSRDAEDEWKCYVTDGVPSGADKRWLTRIDDQDRRLERVLDLVEVMEDKITSYGSVIAAIRDSDSPEQLKCVVESAIDESIESPLEALERKMQEQVEVVNTLQEDVVYKLRDKIEELETALGYSLCSLEKIQAGTAGTAEQMQGHLSIEDSAIVPHSNSAQCSVARDPGQQQWSDGMMVCLQSLDARTERSLTEITQRLDELQEVREQQRVTVWQLSRQLPDVSQRVDQLWTQCEQYQVQLKEHDVRFRFLRASNDGKRQQELDLEEDLERRRELEVRTYAAGAVGNESPRLAQMMERFSEKLRDAPVGYDSLGPEPRGDTGMYAKDAELAGVPSNA